MKALKNESDIIHILLPVVFFYFLGLLCFSSVQTFLTKSSVNLQKLTGIKGYSCLMQQISSEMPIEKRDEWKNVFSSQDPELIFSSALKFDMHLPREYNSNTEISGSTPLSILLF